MPHRIGAAACILAAVIMGCGDTKPQPEPTTGVAPVARPSVSPAVGGRTVPQRPIGEDEVRRHVPGSAAAAIAALEDTIVSALPDSVRPAMRRLLTDTLMQVSWTPRPAEARLLAELYRLRRLERRATWLAGERQAAAGRRAAVGIFVDSLLPRSVASATIVKERAQLGAWIVLPRDARPADIAIAIAAFRSLRREAGDLSRREERIAVRPPPVMPTLSPAELARYSGWLERIESAPVRGGLPGFSPRPVLGVSIEP